MPHEHKTPAKIMRKAFEKEIDKYQFTPRREMTRDQIFEAGMRASLRALAALYNDPVVKAAIFAAAEEGENNAA